MPTELQTLINYTNNDLITIGDYGFDTIGDLFWTLHDNLTAEGCPDSGDTCLLIRNVFWWLRDKYGSAPGSYRLHLIGTLQWINDNWPEGAAEVTMDAILDALWSSIGGQTMTFISYIDAMRGSISEKTVFEPYMASYMKHFLLQ